jgi:hypothetical protein
VAGCGDRGVGPSDSVKDGEFLDSLRATVRFSRTHPRGVNLSSSAVSNRTVSVTSKFYLQHINRPYSFFAVSHVDAGRFLANMGRVCSSLLHTIKCALRGRCLGGGGVQLWLTCQCCSPAPFTVMSSV